MKTNPKVELHSASFSGGDCVGSFKHDRRPHGNSSLDPLAHFWISWYPFEPPPHTHTHSMIPSWTMLDGGYLTEIFLFCKLKMVDRRYSLFGSSNHDLLSLQEMTADELSERFALVKKLKSELKNEEMALVLLKKLKQSQTIQRETTTVGGGATLTPATKAGAKEKTSFSSKNSDHAMAKELVSIAAILEISFLPSERIPIDRPGY